MKGRGEEGAGGGGDGKCSLPKTFHIFVSDIDVSRISHKKSNSPFLKYIFVLLIKLI